MNKIIIAGLIAGCATLAGCSGNHVKLDQLSSDVQVLNQKVDAIQNDVNQLHQEASEASSEAARANQRLDNQETMVRYRK